MIAARLLAESPTTARDGVAATNSAPAIVIDSNIAD
jgi:hypothetical protein